MKSSDILFSLNDANLCVWKVNNLVHVQYEYAWIKECMVLVGAFGRGVDFEAACDDYLGKIRGKTLVFEGPFKQRKEVTVLG